MVLSAAHCYANVDAIAVRTKPHRLDDPIAGSKIFAVKASIRHPEYGLVTGIDKDFWVLKLEGNSTLPLLRLNDSPELPLLYESLTVAGWGTTQSGENVPPDVLQFTNQSIYISNEECVGVTIGGPQQEYNSTASTTVTRDMLCALEVDQGACQGDSGASDSPLVSLLLLHCYCTNLLNCLQEGLLFAKETSQRRIYKLVLYHGEQVRYQPLARSHHLLLKRTTHHLLSRRLGCGVSTSPGKWFVIGALKLE